MSSADNGSSKKRKKEEVPYDGQRRRVDMLFDDSPVDLDVGGAAFRAAPSTLRANSTYFSGLLRRDPSWRRPRDGGGSGGGRTAPTFVDQDPDAFRVLLSFMRKGCVDVEELASVDVLLLAEFLGMDKLLAAAKCRAYRNLHPEFRASGSDEEALEAFGAAYGTVPEAVSSGVLPGALLPAARKRGPKEYCTLVLKGKEYRKFVPVPPEEHDDTFMDFELVAEVKTVSERDASTCGTFLDSLNWLSKNGYRTYEGTELTDITEWRKLSFSKSTADPESDLSTLIVDRLSDKDTTPPEKKYALLVPGLPNQDMGVEVKVDVGNEEQLLISDPDDWPGDGTTEQIASSISMEGRRSVGDAMSWLHEKGYLERETEMEEIYNAMLDATGGEFVGGPLQLYSKRI